MFHDFGAEKRSSKVKIKQTNNPKGKECGIRNYNSVTADCKTGHNIKTVILEKPLQDNIINLNQILSSSLLLLLMLKKLDT